MKKLLLTVAVLFCYTVYAQLQSPFNKLKILAGGTWQMKTKKGFLSERWAIKNNDELSGMGFSVEGKDTTIYEHLKLINTSAGIFYIPITANQNDGKEVRFKLTSSSNNQYVFTNPEHDFPQRIGYRLISRDSVHAWIDGRQNGKLAKQDFYYKRVK